MRNKLIKLLASSVVATVMASIVVTAMPQAALAGPVQKATGSIRMGEGTEANPKQAITFDVFETSPVKGNITYTNFGLADVGSGVWAPAGSFDVQFSVDPSDTIVSTYTFTVNTVTTLSSTSVSFAGNGVQQSGPWQGPFTGTINGSTLSFALQEQNGAESYTLNATGQIDSNGAVAGSWSDNYPLGIPGSRTGKIVIADVGDEVFSFTTTPTCVDVQSGGVAKFGYTIPTGAPLDLSGKAVAVKVTDGGSSGALNDTYQHNFASALGSCEPAGGAYWNYPITAGNLTVFS